jgi:hypothetical protein
VEVESVKRVWDLSKAAAGHGVDRNWVDVLGQLPPPQASRHVEGTRT